MDYVIYANRTITWNVWMLILKLSVTLIDLIVTYNPRNIVKQEVSPFSLSDHDLVLNK